MKLFKNRNSRAFTYIELIFVIIILGIVASLGSDMIANAYQNYLLQNATHKAAFKVELAVEKIANLLRYRIPGTPIARDPGNLNDTVSLSDQTPDDKTHSMLEWIGTAYESFDAAQTPGWSGFCDLKDSNISTVSTPGSNLDLATQIMGNLSGGDVNMSANFSTGGKQHPAIFFRDLQYSDTKYYDPLTCMGLTGSDTSCISSVKEINTTAIQFDANATSRPNKHLSEHYKLAWTAYSICPTGDGSNGEKFNLVLMYNYQPWEGEYLRGGNRCNYGVGTGNPPKRSVLVRDITVFKFAASGNTMRIKICAQSSIGEDKNITLCKEKVVLR